MDPATIAHACLLIMPPQAHAEQAYASDVCFPPLPFGKIVALIGERAFIFYVKGTPEYDRHWETRDWLLDSDPAYPQ